MDIVSALSSVANLGSAWVLWLLLLLSAASLAVAAERWWLLRRNRRLAEDAQPTVLRALRGGDLDALRTALWQDKSVQGRVLLAATERLADGAEAVADAIEGEFGRERGNLERGLNFLGTVGSNAPFLGLFGTVIGVIEAFHHLAGGNESAMGLVMQGLAEALVATAVGIFVALPAVVAYNALSKQVHTVGDDIASLGKLLTALLHRRPDTARVVAVAPGTDGRLHTVADKHRA